MVFKSKREAPAFHKTVHRHIDLTFDHMSVGNFMVLLTDTAGGLIDAQLEVAWAPDSLDLYVTGFIPMSPSERAKEEKRLAAIDIKARADERKERAELKRLLQKYKGRLDIPELLK